MRHVEVLLFPRIPRVRCQVVGEFQVCGEDTEVFVCVHVFCVVLPSQEVGRKFENFICIFQPLVIRPRF